MLYDKFKQRLYPDRVATDNNGLTNAVEVLEAIYTDPAFPSRAPVLEQSLKESGKSRADLWSLAGITAVEYTIETNNLKGDFHLTSKIVVTRCSLTVSGPHCPPRMPPPAGRGGLHYQAEQQWRPPPPEQQPPLPDGAGGLRARGRGEAVHHLQTRGPPQPHRGRRGHRGLLQGQLRIQGDFKTIL